MYRPDKSFMRDPATVNCRIYVGNLDESVTPDKLEERFKTHGAIRGVVVQRGFAFIQYEDESGAQLAIQNEHGALFVGRKLNVRQAYDTTKNKTGPGGDETGAGNPPKSLDGPPHKMRRAIGGPGPGGRGGGIGMRPQRDLSPPNVDEHNYRDVAPFYGREPSFMQQAAPGLDRSHTGMGSERNDCEIIVVVKALTEYAEYIERRLKSIGLTVDLLFPNEDVPIGRVLANISGRGCLYAILVTPQNEEHRSLTLNILHGIPQEHRNMPIDDAVALINRNFDTYMRGEKNVPVPVPAPNTAVAAERHPEAIQILLNLLADNRQLTTLQYDRVIKYLQEKRDIQFRQEVGDTTEQERDHTKEAELQNRIMNILNKNATAPSVNITPASSITNAATPILNNPSVQKALDSLLQGDILKNITSSGRLSNNI